MRTTHVNIMSRRKEQASCYNGSRFWTELAVLCCPLTQAMCSLTRIESAQSEPVLVITPTTRHCDWLASGLTSTPQTLLTGSLFVPLLVRADL